MSRLELNTNVRAERLSESPTLAMSARAKELKASGQPVLDFSAGEPDFHPPAAVTAAVAEFLRTNPVHYAPVPGLPALRDAAAAELGRYHGRPVARGELLVSCGAKHSLANLFQVTLSPGDEVVLPAPYWVSYADMVRLGDGAPVIVPTRREHNWRLQPEALAAALTDRTRYIVLGNPTNPTGAGYPAALLRELGEVMARVAPRCWLLVDDIYRRLTYGDFKHPSVCETLRDVTDQVVVVDGVSKSYAMTGYRIGFLLAPAPVVSAAARLQGHTTSGAATPSQVAALTALTDPSCDVAVREMHAAFTRRRALMLAGLGALPGVDIAAPDGAFYLFCDVSRHIGPATGFPDDLAFAAWLLDQKHVATVPGTAFGAPGHLRISYAAADEALGEGLSRIEEAIHGLPTAAG